MQNYSFLNADDVPKIQYGGRITGETLHQKVRVQLHSYELQNRETDRCVKEVPKPTNKNNEISKKWRLSQLYHLNKAYRQNAETDGWKNGKLFCRDDETEKP